jgi:hypothetical protein
LSFVPFLAFVPLTVFTSRFSLFFFWGFFGYLVLWILFIGATERTHFRTHWKKRITSYIGLIILTQVILSIACLMIYVGGYTSEKPKMELKKPAESLRFAFRPRVFGRAECPHSAVDG